MTSRIMPIVDRMLMPKDISEDEQDGSQDDHGDSISK